MRAADSLVGAVVVTAAVIAPIIPGGAGPREHRRAARRRGGAGQRRPLPLAAVPASRTRAAEYGMAALDDKGRIADRVVMGALWWEPGARLDIAATRERVTVRASAAGAARVSAHGFVRLPARVRDVCDLRPGDCVLLAADPSRQVLRVFPPATLDALLPALDKTDPTDTDLTDTDGPTTTGGSSR